NIHTYSDTEVILHAYTEWGEDCVHKFNGMFAFAIWDRRNHRLFCARDRLGIKPFYYWHDGRKLVFASEIKAILAAGVPADVNSNGLQDYLTFQFCLGDKTLFDGIRKLEPGYLMTAELATDRLVLKMRQYWDVRYDIDEMHDEEWFVDHLSSLLEDSIRIRLRSDVPLGAHLSGGLDSSTVVSLAASMLDGMPLRTFTGAFREGSQFDETRYARLVAEAAGAEYHEVYPSAEDFIGYLPKLIHFMDEPLAGPGLFPQYCVSKLASDHVKVVLGGQGGDEIFIGYARYMVAYLEKCLQGAISQTSNANRYAVSLESITPNLPVLQQYVPMLQRFWREGLFGPMDERYFRLIDRSDGHQGVFEAVDNDGSYSPFESFRKIFNREGLHSLINRMTYFDLKASLPALLHVEDRTSMSVSLESRVPLLDYRIVELLATIPPNIKFAGGRMKHLFKKAVKNFVPEEVYNRQDKMGFPVPLQQWFRGEAREFVRDTLLSKAARERGLYNMQAVENAIHEEGNYGRVIWGLLCLELWHRAFIDEATAA
ncbi:MAG: asparagine synthase (glutamine-hydrolyzing), partial [Gammaproteobacteria bacterium]